jgi:large subunit ribosomal protein L6
MSRIGNKPISIPDKVKVALEGRTVKVEGPKGKLSWTHRPEIAVAIDAGTGRITVTRRDDRRQTRALHGTTRMLIQNMLIGCLSGYERKLEIFGVGYGVQLQGAKLLLNVGLANPGAFDVPAGLTVTVQTPQARGETEPARLAVAGADKQAVGEFAARLRRLRPPEPYKGKGVRYVGEYVRRKVGKAFAGAGGTT